MEKMKFKFNEVYFGNNLKINKNYRSQFLSYIKNISIFKLPLRILFIFGRQIMNEAFVNLENITVILLNRWLA